jgi:prophage DNA circulation protein
MSWRDRLRYAMWRELEFLTESHEAKEGQRLVVHELPGRDDPVVEDLGAKARSWRVSAYFIGPDYDQGRDKFLALLRTPGAAWLEHPWLGRVWVRAQDWATSESNAEGGWCKVSVDFAPGGADTPQPEVDVVDAAAAAVDGYVAAAADFAPDGVGSAGAFAQLLARVQAGMDAVRTALARARMPLTMLAQVLTAVDSAKALLAEGLALPGEYSRALRSINGALGALGVVGADLDDDARVRVVAAMARQGQPQAVVVAGLGAADAPALRRNLATEQAARQHWAVATAMQVALADYTTVAARDAALASVLQAVDALLPTAGDDVFQAAAAARLAVQQALALQQLAPTQTRMLVAPLPSAVLAYRMGVDEALLLARNSGHAGTGGLRHPLFVGGVVNV